MTSRLAIGKRIIEIGDGITIENAVISSGEHPDAFLFLIDGRPIPITTVPNDGDVIEAIRVASGG